MPQELVESQPTGNINRSLLVISALLAMVILVVGFVTLPDEQQYRILDVTPPTPVPTPLGGQPFAEDEVGIVVADFKFDVNTLGQDIADIVLDYTPHVIRVTHLIDDQQQARSVADTYNAQYVVWGDESNRGKRVKFYALDAPSDMPMRFDLLVPPRVSIDLGGKFVAGLVQLAENEPLDALGIFNEMTVGMPDEVAYRDGMEMIYFFRAVAYEQVENFTDAITNWLSYFLFVPDDLLAIYHRGNAYQGLGRTPLAIEDYEAVLEQNPLFAPAYMRMGQIYAELGSELKAMDYFEQALELEDDNPDLNYAMAKVQQTLGDYTDAVSSYERVLAIRPTDRMTYLDIASLYEQLEQLSLAVGYYNRALRYYPEDVDILYRRGLLYIEQGKYDDALDDFETALRLSPDDVRFQHAIGQVYQAQGDLDRAFAEYGKALAINLRYAPTFASRGEIYLVRELYDRALEAFTRALELNPHDADIYRWRGQAYIASGEYELAIADFQESIRLNPDVAWSHFYLGEANLALDDTELALREYTHAIELDDSQPIFYEARGKLYLDVLKQMDEARADLLEAVALYGDDPIPEDIQKALEQLEG